MIRSAQQASPMQESLSEADRNAQRREPQLRCPRCGNDLLGAACSQCELHMDVRDGIVCALPEERAVYYARFIADYESIRAAEGRASATREYYCGLPYRDVTGNNSAQWRIRARSYDALMRNVLRPHVPEGGRILDLGAGNCWMSFRLALAGYSPCAVDLLTNLQDGLGAAAHYQEYLPELFPRFQAELTRLPFQSEQFDVAIFNASFHYTEDGATALHEALRCTKAGGIVVISDTPWYRCDQSGRQMVAERQAIFRARYGTASDSLCSVEYLTDERLRELARRAGVEWNFCTPHYGMRWALRPLMARLRRHREPSRFRLYVTRKTA